MARIFSMGKSLRSMICSRTPLISMVFMGCSWLSGGNVNCG
jgi:hypothetical protein